MTADKRTVYFGTAVHSTARSTMAVVPRVAIGVDAGTIAWMDTEAADGAAAAAAHDWAGAAVVTASPGEFFAPGFLDTHIHASQYPNVGLFGKTTLLDWLETYTFPLESSFKDVAVAKNVYPRVIARTLSHGTTTASYYATVHADATNVLADLALAAGQRAFVGRCCMDANSPAFYCDETVEAAQEATKAVVDHIAAIDPDHALVCPILTPRFAISCTRELMTWLGAFSREHKLPVQTHVSENKDEIAFTAKLHPYADSYTGVYDACGLLHDRTILAHAVHLSDDERALVAARGAGVSHCPISNSSITSGEARVKWLLDGGVKVGLGTDVSGGYSPSILAVARQALLVSRHLAMKGDDYHKLSLDEVFFLATLGGAQVCGLEDKVGNFVPGKRWDAQLISLVRPGSPVDLFPGEAERLDDMVAKWFFNGDDRNVSKVWVDGRLVAGADSGL
ncbi:uncharacterized protein V1510DRAFT_412990 [Dipodascopsis tothii]|uniref:uncharacterized protein n=1 Tax=Dipodascopsis tothii TaxID=44089 RepID=UPI0034CFC4B3